MTYADRENSIALGAPFECYEFLTPLGNFRYTTLPVEVELGTGEDNAMQLYEPLQVTRGAAEISAIIDTLATMDFNIPVGSPLAQAYLGRNVPEYLTTRVYRAHWGDDLETEFAVEWRGEATGYSYSDEGALVVSTQSIIQSRVQGMGATVYYQLSCNHRVYDARCKADPAEFTHVTTVTGIDNIRIRVASQGYANGLLQLGRMVNPATDEERSIFANENDEIQVTYPFLNLKVGDTVHLILGCNNTMGTCFERFDNVVNYGGFRYVPLQNILLDFGETVVKSSSGSRAPIYHLRVHKL